MKFYNNQYDKIIERCEKHTLQGWIQKKGNTVAYSRCIKIVEDLLSNKEYEKINRFVQGLIAEKVFHFQNDFEANKYRNLLMRALFQVESASVVKNFFEHEPQIGNGLKIRICQETGNILLLDYIEPEVGISLEDLFVESLKNYKARRLLQQFEGCNLKLDYQFVYRCSNHFFSERYTNFEETKAILQFFFKKGFKPNTKSPEFINLLNLIAKSKANNESRFCAFSLIMEHTTFLDLSSAYLKQLPRIFHIELVKENLVDKKTLLIDETYASLALIDAIRYSGCSGCRHRYTDIKDFLLKSGVDVLKEVGPVSGYVDLVNLNPFIAACNDGDYLFLEKIVGNSDVKKVMNKLYNCVSTPIDLCVTKCKYDLNDDADVKAALVLLKSGANPFDDYCSIDNPVRRGFTNYLEKAFETSWTLSDDVLFNWDFIFGPHEDCRIYPDHFLVLILEKVADRLKSEHFFKVFREACHFGKPKAAEWILENSKWKDELKKKITNKEEGYGSGLDDDFCDETLMLLLKNGADPTTLMKGKCLYNHAKQNGFNEVLKYLENNQNYASKELTVVEIQQACKRKLAGEVIETVRSKKTLTVSWELLKARGNTYFHGFLPGNGFKQTDTVSIKSTQPVVVFKTYFEVIQGLNKINHDNFKGLAAAAEELADGKLMKGLSDWLKKNPDVENWKKYINEDLIGSEIGKPTKKSKIEIY